MSKKKRGKALRFCQYHNYRKFRAEDQTEKVDLFKDIMDYLDGKIDSPEDGQSTYWENFYAEHGALVEIRTEAYYDVHVYEDGYEERYYIGE